MGTLNRDFFKHSRGERLPKKKHFYMELQKTEMFFFSFFFSFTLPNEENVRKACTPDAEAKLILGNLYLFRKNWTPLNVTLLYFLYHSELRWSPGHKHQNHFDYCMLQIWLMNRVWKIPSPTRLGQIGNFPRQETSICAESKLSPKNKMFLVSQF